MGLVSTFFLLYGLAKVNKIEKTHATSHWVYVLLYSICTESEFVLASMDFDCLVYDSCGPDICYLPAHSHGMYRSDSNASFYLRSTLFHSIFACGLPSTGISKSNISDDLY